MNDSRELIASYAACRAIVRGAKSSFTPAFRLLPTPKRQGMNALYAFFRLIDDASDDAGTPDERRDRVQEWEAAFEQCLRGEFSHPIHPALNDTLTKYQVDPCHLRAVIAGVKQDCDELHFATYAQLEPYLDRVASAVGLACIPVWGLSPGVTSEAITTPALAAGRAFQLTNILRDLHEDTARGRCYLPADELAQFGLEVPLQPCKKFHEFMTFQLARTEALYHDSRALVPLLSRDGRIIFGLMFGVYHELLRRIASSPEAVLRTRVRVPRTKKLRLLATAYRQSWGRA